MAPAAWALPIITNVAESGGDNEATDTIPAKWTGVTFPVSVNNEPRPGLTIGQTYAVGLFGDEVPAFVDRNHEWTAATPTIPIPKYLVGGEYIMSGNDNRDNAEYLLDVTISKKAFVYMLIDDRLGDASNANPPNFPDWTATRTGAPGADMAWIIEDGWQPMKTGANRHGNPDWPDHIGMDEGADGAGSGQGVNQWSSIYMKVFEAGTFQIKAPNNNGQNMYGAVVVPYPEKPIVTGSRGNLFGFTFSVLDGSQTRVNPTTVAVTLDGAPVQVDVSKSGDVTTVRYTASPVFLPNSPHTAVLTFSDNGSPATPVSETLAFTVERFARLTADDAVPAAEVDTGTSGFLARVVQGRDTALWPTLDLPNTTQRAEAQLAGRLIEPISGNPVPNFATAGSGPGGTHPVSVVNWNQEARPGGTAAQAGNFVEPAFPDAPIPGIPGTDPESADNTDNIAAEVVGYLELKAGLYRFGVNSDDGFRVAAGRDPYSPAAKELGVFSGGRGASDSLFYVSVATDGIYPVRLIWYEGGGGANLEFFSEKVGSTPPARALVNDRSNADAVKSYARLRTPAGPYASASPLGGATGVWPAAPIEAQITDNGTSVANGSVRLLVNGQQVAATVSKSGNVTTARHTPTTLLPSSQVVNVELQYSDTASPARQYSKAWQFTTLNYSALPVLQPGFAVPAGQINTATSGFAVDIYQMLDGAGATVPRPNNANTIAAAETQLARAINDPATGQPYANGASAGTLPDGRHEVEVINWNQQGPANAGAFTAGNDPNAGNAAFTDAEIPGLFSGEQNWVVGEAVGYAELKAGIYRLGVNSDDGFRLSTGLDPKDLASVTLGSFDGGRGSTADLPQSACDFVVLQDGIYPLRLLWFEGTGGANLEFFQVDVANGSAKLVNDRSAAGTIKVYRQYTGQARASLRSWSPARGATGVARRAPIEAVLENASGDITLTVNGNAVPVERTVNGTRTTIRHTPTSNYGSNATVQVGLNYGGVTASWSFRVETYVEATPRITGITPAGGNVTITWENGGTLESGPTILGPWTSTGDSDGSFTEAAANGERYYRVKR